MSGNGGLPKGWWWTSLGEVAHFINGDRGKNYPSASAFVPVGIPFINAGHLQNGQVDNTDMNYISEDRFDLLGSGKVQNGDVLFCLRGSLGKAAIVQNIDRAAIASSLVILRPFENALTKLLYYFVISPFGKSEIAKYDNGSAQPNLSATNVKQFTIPLAPPYEQRRIVAKIEELFSDLDAGVAALERARANLKRYRASVLKAAVEGKLTEEWRVNAASRRVAGTPLDANANTRQDAGSTFEPASKLLERILAERRRKWEADQLAKFAKQGKQPPKGWKDKYVEPKGPDTSALPELPAGWCWATVEQISEFARYGSSAKTNEDESGVPVLRMGNIVDGALDLTNLKYLPKKHDEFPDLLLREGDLLFNRTNSAELVGKSAVYEGQPSPCSYASYLISVRCLTGCDPRHLCTFINSAFGRRWIKTVVSQQVGQANVNGTKLQALAVPLPPLDEQKQVISEVAEKLSQIEAAESAIEHGLQRAARLRQSILKRAFEGKLVPQDLNDEPAAEMLERMKADNFAKGRRKRTPCNT